MRVINVFFLVMSLAGCETAGLMRPAQDMGSVTAATQDWVAAYNSRDPVRIVALYDAEAALWGTTSTTFRKGTPGIADYFKDAGKRPEARVTIVSQDARASGEHAWNSGAYTFTDVRDGKAVTSPARFSFAYRRAGGRWVIVDHHSSRMPAP